MCVRYVAQWLIYNRCSKHDLFYIVHVYILLYSIPIKNVLILLTKILRCERLYDVKWKKVIQTMHFVWSQQCKKKWKRVEKQHQNQQLSLCGRITDG